MSRAYTPGGRFNSDFERGSISNGITDDLEEIAEGLISYSDDKSEIDYLLENLYDLADNSRIWIKTF